MNYQEYLLSKNLSESTIRIYLLNLKIWNKFIKNIHNPFNIQLFREFILDYAKDHKPNSTRLMFNSMISYFKFLNKTKLIKSCKEFRLPKQEFYSKNIITIEEFNQIKKLYKTNTWLRKRNWLIFSLLFMTGIRVNELNEIKKDKIINNRIMIKGKGNKHRYIFLNDYILGLINQWNKNEINIKSNNQRISNKQVITIISNLVFKYLNKKITPHSLRRSYATHLIRNGVDIKVISKLMGHSDINTTSRYIFLSDEEIYKKIENVFN